MSALHVCGACVRHVRESVCPFCGTGVERGPVVSVPTAARAILIAGIASAAVATSACFGGGYGGPPPGLAENTTQPTAEQPVPPRCGAPLPNALPELNGTPGLGTASAGQMTEDAATAKRLFDAERWPEAVKMLTRVVSGETGDDPGNRELAQYHLAIALYRLHRVGDAARVFVDIARERGHLKHAETLLWIYKLAPEVPALVRALSDYDANDVMRFDNPNQREMYWGLSYLVGRERVERGERAEAIALFQRVDAASQYAPEAQRCLASLR